MTTLTATGTYRQGEPTQGLHSLIDETRRLGATVRLDTVGRDVHICVRRETEATGPGELAAELTELAEALPPRASDRTGSWRRSGPVPF